MPSLKKAWRRFKVRMSPDGPAIIALADALDGIIFIEEAHWLFNAARGRRTIVEIGSYRGKSAVLLAKGSADVGGRLLCIDPHLNATGLEKTKFSKDDNDRFHAAINAHGVADRITKWVMTSQEARPKYDGTPIDLLWIDGDHSYPGVKFDLSAWKDLVKVGGIIAAHDYTHDEPVKVAWHEEITADKRFGPMTLVRSIASAVRER
jgi:predicted O-methyltransferase YrrM